MFLPKPVLDHDLPTLIFSIARIISMHHHLAY
jgi:hypothetical protein